MKQVLFTLIMMLCTTLTWAQNAEKLYNEGKSLYDAKKYEAAIEKLRPAAEKGHKKAQYRLGRCYDKGNGVEEDHQMAFYWYSKGAEQNHAKSLYQLGKCHYKGKGTPVNYTKAVQYYTKAANQGNANGRFGLGKCYMKGKGVKADLEKAKSLFQKAVKDEKDGPEILQELKEEASFGDDDAKAILKMIGE
ncbi:MAG: tetratricopeptide repeat protein [Bacteroidales bacterium]|nr:tetratricopeptide repeat protein [Bacteroidales bacterium]